MPITVEELRERTKQWLQPISADAPAGAAATVDPRYEFIRTEAAKMDSPTASGTVEWKPVLEQGGEILEQKSKDFIIASYVAYALYSTRGLDGLVTGLTLLSEICDQYWPTMFPELKRIRGRVNALGWFIERTCMLLPNTKVSASDRAVVEGLALASKTFATVMRAKFEGNAPAMGPLLEGIERLSMSLPAEAPPPPPPPVAPPPGAASAPAPVAAAPVAAAAPSVALSSGPAAELSDVGDIANFLRETGMSLARAGAAVRRADSSDPVAYRLVRAGLWMPLAGAPPAQGGKTSVPAVPAALRTQFEKMAANAKWPDLLEECESAMNQHRLWLDLQRYTFQALSALGATHARAKDAVLIDVSAFLRRLPTLPTLTYADGEGFADAQTKMWLETDVMTSGDGGGGAAKPAAGDDLGGIVAEARALITKGQAPEAIALLHGKASGIAPASARFRARLALARLCVQGSQLGIAKAIFEGLDREVTAHGLDVWEPALAAEVLEGAVVCLRSIAKGGKPLPPEAGLMYDRLCRIDPAAAAKVGA